MAVEQAGAYIVQRRYSLAQYLEDWRSRQTEVHSWHDERVMNYPYSVAVTWQTTIDRLSAGERALLRLLAWFGPEPVPLFVFESEDAESVWRAATDLIGTDGESNHKVFDALAGLAGFSMVRWDADTESVTVHRLVQNIVRDRIPPDEVPVWVAKSSDEGVVMSEGCLSLPEHFAEIERPDRIRVDYLDYQGAPASLEANGLLSRCIQHEFDHLDGILFVDHLSALKRNMILRKLVKARRQKESA